MHSQSGVVWKKTTKKTQYSLGLCLRRLLGEISGHGRRLWSIRLKCGCLSKRQKKKKTTTVCSSLSGLKANINWLLGRTLLEHGSKNALSARGKKKRCASLSGLSYYAGSLLIVHIINTTLSVFLVSSCSSEIRSCAASSRTTAAAFVCLFVSFRHESVCLFQQVMWSRLPMRNNIYFFS